MRALVTGANGFVGSKLSRRLLERGDAVRALVQPGSDRGLIAGLAVERVEGDVGDAAALRRAVEGVDVVYHLAGIRRSPAKEDFFRVNAEGTRRVCEALAAAGGGRFVLAGSLAAVGPRKDSPAEDAPFRPADWYGESKAEAERIARSFSGRLEVAVARPSRIVGPGDRENLAFFKIVARGLELSIGGGPRPFSTVDVEDVVEAFVALGVRPEAVGEAFFISRDTTTLEGIQQEAARALGKRTRRIAVPAKVFEAAARAADLFSTATGRHLPLNRKLAQQLLAPGWTCSTRKAQEKLGFVARTPLRESIEASARWYREMGWLPKAG